MEAQPPQGRDHLAGHQRAGRIAEALAQRGADGRGRLHDGVLVAGLQGGPDLFDLVALGDRPDRADRRALAALDAGHLVEVAVERRADDGFESAVLREQGADVLDLAAHAHAAAALDALAVVAEQGGRRRVDPLADLLARVLDLANSQFGGQGLQLAILVAVARLALAVVLGKEQFDHGAAGVADAVGVGEDLHSRGGGHGARGDEVPRPLDLDDADAAGADGLQAFDVAEGRECGRPPFVPRRGASFLRELPRGCC